MKKSNTKSSAGFSLVEALVTVVIFGIVFAAIGTFFLRTSQQTQNIAQASQDREFSRDIDQALTSDFETLGNNLSVNYSEIFPINEIAAFFPNKYYSVSGDEVIKEVSGEGSPLVGNVLWQGTGTVRIAGGSSFDFNLRSPSADTLPIAVRYSGRDYSFAIYENNVVVYETTIRDGIVNFELNKIVASNQPGVCLQIYNLSNQEIHRTQTECSSEWFQPELQMHEDEGVMNFALTAATCRFNDDHNNPVRLPLLPVLEGTRPWSPVVQAQNGFTLLKSNPEVSPLYLAEPVSIREGEKVYLKVTGSTLPDKEFQEKDVFLVADYWQNRSCMVELLENAGNGMWLVLPVTDSMRAQNSNFQSLYSMPSDFAGHEFPAGVKIVKLSPPVVYETQANRKRTGLFRREGTEPWILIMPSVAKFRIAEDRQNSGFNYKIAMATFSEETGEIAPDAQTKSLFFAPRGLSRSIDVQ